MGKLNNLSNIIRISAPQILRKLDKGRPAHYEKAVLFWTVVVLYHLGGMRILGRNAART